MCGIMELLTTREREVVQLLAQGRRQTEIAQVLCISPRTVEGHVASARRKTQCLSAFDLALRVALEAEK